MSNNYFDYFNFGIYLFIGNYLPKKTISTKLNGIFKIILLNPLLVLSFLFIIYPLICLIILPFYLLSYFISSFGSFIILIIIFIIILRYFTRILIFPGSLASLKRNISKEYLKGMSSQFDKIGISINNFSSSIIHLSSGIGNNLTLKLNEFDLLVNRSLPILIIVLKEGIQVLENKVIIYYLL